MTAAQGRRAARRPDALTRERILSAAISLLDENVDDVGTLTLRNLTSRLSTGSGAIYHHVATMAELRAAAADEVLSRRIPPAVSDKEPRTALREIAFTIYDVMDAHHWFAAQLIDDPVQPAAVRIWKALGSQLRRLDHTAVAASDAGSVLFRFILGSAAQHVSGPARLSTGENRTKYLARAAERLHQSDTDPLMDEIAAAVADHDDRSQFLTGLDIIFRGLAR